MSILRIVIQFLISAKVDNRDSLGGFLSRIIRRDPEMRHFYESLRELDARLMEDAASYLEHSACRHDPLPPAIVRRSLEYSDRRSLRRKRSRRVSTILVLLGVFFFGSGVFFSSQWASFHEARASQPERERPISATLQADPPIFEELVRLCRETPNDVGPFFIDVDRESK